MFRFPIIHWPNTAFLAGTLLVTLTAVPAYIWRYGLNGFQIGLFLLFFIATGLSITLGYHRFFSHKTFAARGPVRLFTLLFGAAAFENSALRWAADHRLHHKHVDHDDDPYDITKGFFHAHIGWILFRVQPDTPLDVVKDLQQDALVMWQDRYYRSIAVGIGFALPALIGFAFGGWVAALGSFLIAGVARVVFVHHMTFFINSLCHTLGRQPYSSRCTARDSGIMAWFTFGEGYHNFHHEFQHDYRNGVKPWQFDPTKWAIWLLYKLRLVDQLRRVPEEKILRVQLAEQERRIALKLRSAPSPASELVERMLQSAQQPLMQAFQNWERLKAEYHKALETKMDASRERVAELRAEFREASARLRQALREWQAAQRMALAQLAEAGA